MSKYKTALQNLEGARKLIRTKYTTGELAHDCYGDECSPRSPKAVAFCALGAVRNIDGPGERKAVELLRQAAHKLIRRGNDPELSPSPTNDSIFTVNDRYGKEDTLRMFSMAIRLAKQA